jgi:hypothetical protein
MELSAWFNLERFCSFRFGSMRYDIFVCNHIVNSCPHTSSWSLKASVSFVWSVVLLTAHISEILKPFNNILGQIGLQLCHVCQLLFTCCHIHGCFETICW